MAFDPLPYMGRLMQFARKYGVKIDLDNPVTIQDKINWLNMYNCTPLKTQCADKILVHEYCKERLGEDRCIPILKTYDSTDDIVWDELPQQFVIKCNHGSGMNIVVKDKSSENEVAVKAKLNGWLKQDFTFRNGVEAHYHDIKHRVLVEQFMDDGHQDLVDYKFMCCNGEPKMLQVTHNTHGSDNHMNYYDMEFNYLDIERTDHKSEPENLDKKPDTFDEMVGMARKLSNGFDFVRVDFYEIDGRVYLGELTFTPGVGLFQYKRKSDAIMLGNLINLTKKVIDTTVKNIVELTKPKGNVKKNLCIVHYNTPELTNYLIRSINKTTKDAKIFVFDNSDKHPFVCESGVTNVTLFDNTNGEIINFDKWLAQYPKRTLSPGKSNNYGSAKHCYSVEKCMDLIGEPFILLDSDVIIKKDLTPLFDDKCIYVGQTVNQPNSDIKRILPYVNYINVPMCRSLGVHYFNDIRMHGLRNITKNFRADYYDTGANFFVEAEKYPHAEINVNDYAIHFMGGSWSKVKNHKLNRKLSVNDFVTANRRFWDNGYKSNKVVYTCITGGYDVIPVPEKITEGFDYICFTDDATAENPIWEMRPIPEELMPLSKVKQQRTVKICPHRYLMEYDFSIWIDGSVLVKDDLNEFINMQCNGDASIFIPQHPVRKCIYDEAQACIRMRKDAKETIEAQMNAYRNEGFPKGLGLCQSNIVARYHNKPECIKMMECWAGQVKDHSLRDQLSFNFAAWKNPDTKIVYLDKNMFDSKYFFWDKFHGKNGVHSILSKARTQTNQVNQMVKQLQNSNKSEDTSELTENPVIAERAADQMEKKPDTPKKYRAMLRRIKRPLTSGIPTYGL